MAVEVTINGLSHEGRGVGKIEGKTVFVQDALPGETVSINITKRRGKFDEADTLEVLSASDKRVEPVCEYFGRCGGCSLQHLATDEQIKHKQSVLADHFTHFGKLAPKAWLEPLTAPTEGYRQKARLGVRFVAKKGGALVGFRERGGRFLMDMQSCQVLHPAIGKNINALRELITSLEAHNQIAQIEAAVDDQVCALIFRNLKPLSDEDAAKLIEYGKAHNNWIFLQPKGPKTIHRIYPEGEESLSYTHVDHDVSIQFRPEDFMQVNSEINRKMLNQAIDLLDLQNDDVVIDFFCGLGNFSLPIAKKVKQVIGIEGDEPMTLRARENAIANGLENTAFHAANLFEPFEYLPIPTGVTKVLLDPPRSGAAQCMHYLGKSNIEHIVYVSCNPATLARDAGILVNEYGYTMEKAGVMDMFPHTAHVESMAVFIK